MPLIREEDVFHRDAIGTNRLDDLIAFDLQDTWVVGALDDEHRADNVLGVEQRRNCTMAFAIAGWITLIVCAVFTIVMGVAPQPIIDLFNQASTFLR